MNKFLFTFMLGAGVLATSCNKDPERPQEYMTVYMPLVGNNKAERLRDVPIVFNTVNLLENIKFSKERDTVFNLGIYCGGSIMPQQDIALKLALATDSLTSLQKKGVSQSVYTLLPAEYYNIDSWEANIPQGEVMTYFPISIKTSAIPQDSQYVLPIRIESTNVYELDNSRSFILLAIKFE
jgi:hypothetical protein